MEWNKMEMTLFRFRRQPGARCPVCGALKKLTSSQLHNASYAFDAEITICATLWHDFATLELTINELLICFHYYFLLTTISFRHHALSINCFFFSIFNNKHPDHPMQSRVSNPFSHAHVTTNYFVCLFASKYKVIILAVGRRWTKVWKCSAPSSPSEFRMRFAGWCPANILIIIIIIISTSFVRRVVAVVVGSE